jgi:phage tail-like protein
LGSRKFPACQLNSMWLNTAKVLLPNTRHQKCPDGNEEHAPVMTWMVKNAWPVKLESPVLKADASEAAIESLELAHEGISIETS